jgi:beta-mannosidase
MEGRLRRNGAHGVTVLDRGWHFCDRAAGEYTLPPPAGDTAWRAVAWLGTAAACAREGPGWTFETACAEPDSRDFWYRLEFDADPQAPATLGFDGLATLCEVWLNGERLLESRSMFAMHECDVVGRLHATGNELVIVSRALAPVLAQRRARPAWRVPMLAQQQLRWIRTTLLGRTPGWSPTVPAAGPWRDVWLRRQAPLLAQAPFVSARVEGGAGLLELAVEPAVPGAEAVVLRLTREGRHWELALTPDAARRRWQGTLQLPQPDLWWPHTHGEPALYGLSLQIDGAEPGLLDLGCVGFREIEVHTDDGDFQIRVNGVPIFCRGACWTPLDVVSLRSTPSQMREAIAQARVAGMNMLRVGGTMVYEEDHFYDECDAQGVLVWQDLMFANMDYAAEDAAFGLDVELEMRQQLPRWQARPSLAVVCGNSEVAQQAAMWGATRERWAPTLFSYTLARAVAEHLPGVTYWPSSAWGGAFPHQVNEGTTSYYGVGAYLRPLDDARQSGLRFATEALALANVPAPTTVERMPGGATLRVTHAAWKARAPRDLTAGWDFEDVRDHYLRELFQVDPVRLRYEDHARYIELARVVSGEVMAAAFSQWRAQGSACRGALVWFLRDLWPGAGWGVLDDTGLPKPCWHALKRVLQPQAVLLTDEGNSGLFAHLVNEKPGGLQAQLTLEVWRGDTRVEHATRAVEVAGHSVQAVPLAALLDGFFDLNHAYRFGPLAHDVVLVALHGASGNLIGQAFHFPAGMGVPRDTGLGLAATYRVLDQGEVEVTVTAKRLALAVWFDAPGFVADDEYFHLGPGQSSVVVLRPLGQAKPWYGVVTALNAATPVTVRAAS